VYYIFGIIVITASCWFWQAFIAVMNVKSVRFVPCICKLYMHSFTCLLVAYWFYNQNPLADGLTIGVKSHGHHLNSSPLGFLLSCMPPAPNNMKQCSPDVGTRRQVHKSKFSKIWVCLNYHWDIYHVKNRASITLFYKMKYHLVIWVTFHVPIFNKTRVVNVFSCKVSL
jgi:hypothetical protein